MMIEMQCIPEGGVHHAGGAVELQAVHMQLSVYDLIRLPLGGQQQWHNTCDRGDQVRTGHLPWL